MKQIEVVVAIMHDDEGRVFATQRRYGEWLPADVKVLEALMNKTL